MPTRKPKTLADFYEHSMEYSVEVTSGATSTQNPPPLLGTRR